MPNISRRLIRSVKFSTYSAFQIDELHRHNQNLVGTLHATSLLWSTDMKNAVKNFQVNIHLNRQ